MPEVIIPDPNTLATPFASGAMASSLVLPTSQLSIVQNAWAARSQVPCVRPLWTNFSAFTSHPAGDGTINLTYADGYPGQGGTTSVLMHTGGNCGGGSNSMYVEITNAGINMTNHHFVVAVKVLDWSKFKSGNGIRLSVGSDAGTSFINYCTLTWNDPTAVAVANRWTVPDGSWLLIPLPWSLGTFYNSWNLGGSGTPSRTPDPTGFPAGITTCNRIQFRIYDTSADNTSNSALDASLQLGMIGMAPNVTTVTANKWTKGVCCVSMDDCDISQKLAYPILRDYGIQPSIHVIRDQVDLATAGASPQVNNYLAMSDLVAFQKIGSDICAHANLDANHGTANGFPGLEAATPGATAADLSAELAWLSTNGFDTRHFAYPGGFLNDTVKTILKSLGFVSARTTCGGQAGPCISMWPPMDPMKLFGFSIQYNWTLATDIQPFFDNIARHNLFGMPIVHRFVTGTPTSGGTMNVYDFETMFKYALNLGITFIPIREVIP